MKEADDLLQKTITDIYYTDDQGLLANASVQTKSLLHIQEQAAKHIGFYMNTNKTE